MDVSTVKSHIQTGNFDNFYIFTGPEVEAQRIYINMIADKSGKSLKRIDSIEDVYGNLRNKSFVSKSYCYVVRDDKVIMQDEKVQAQIKDGLLGNNILILLVTSIDKRLKFYKAYKDIIVEFELLSPDILRKYIKSKLSLSNTNCNKLITICEQDYSRILLEIDKIKRYDNLDGREKSGSADSAFEALVKDGTIYEPPYDAIFDFVDAVLRRNNKLAFALFNHCQRIGESSLVLISVLYTSVKATLQVQTCESRDVAKSTGLNGWQIKKVRERGFYYNTSELEMFLRLIQKVESGIKMGNVDEQIAIPYILTHVL